ncbi:nicotinate-nucleotide--dimethylbenzimidazole phosphoribosyltransferase [Xylophilus rhododendri]
MNIAAGHDRRPARPGPGQRPVAAARLVGVPLEECTGAGTGLDETGIARKVAMLRGVLTLHAGLPGVAGDGEFRGGGGSTAA